MTTNEITDIQITCAPRFDAYKYERVVDLCDPGISEGGFARHMENFEDSLFLSDDLNMNFTMFFAFQRYLFKWGGESLPKDSKEHIAFDFLFLQLYDKEVPFEFAYEEYNIRWCRELKARSELAAAHVRKSFTRRAAEK
ncbi:hypothetical protein [Oceaniferula spumae]